MLPMKYCNSIFFVSIPNSESMLYNVTSLPLCRQAMLCRQERRR